MRALYLSTIEPATENDDVFELIVAPTPQRTGHEVERVAGCEDEVVKACEAADLCIFGLGEATPKLAYLCGYRRAAGKPAVHLFPLGHSDWLSHDRTSR